MRGRGVAVLSQIPPLRQQRWRTPGKSRRCRPRSPDGSRLTSRRCRGRQAATTRQTDWRRGRASSASGFDADRPGCAGRAAAPGRIPARPPRRYRSHRRRAARTRRPRRPGWQRSPRPPEGRRAASNRSASTPAIGSSVTMQRCSKAASKSARSRMVRSPLGISSIAASSRSSDTRSKRRASAARSSSLALIRWRYGSAADPGQRHAPRELGGAAHWRTASWPRTSGAAGTGGSPNAMSPASSAPASCRDSAAACPRIYSAIAASCAGSGSWCRTGCAPAPAATRHRPPQAPPRMRRSGHRRLPPSVSPRVRR